MIIFSVQTNAVYCARSSIAEISNSSPRRIKGIHGNSREIIRHQLRKRFRQIALVVDLIQSHCQHDGSNATIGQHLEMNLDPMVLWYS